MLTPRRAAGRRGAAHFSAHDAKASRLSRSGQLPWFDATHGPVARDLRALLIPLLVGVLLQQGTLVAHALFLRRAGSVSVDAIQVIGSLGRLVVGLSLGVGVGSSVIVSHHFGAHDERRLASALHTAVGLALALGVLVAAGSILGINQLLRLLAVPPAALSDTRAFAYAFLAAAICPMLFNMGTGLQSAVGNVRAFARSSALVFLASVGLDFVFVSLMGLGACGAAFASVGAYLLGSVLVLYELRRAPRSWRLHLSQIRIIIPIAGDMLFYALPLLIQSVALMLADGSVLTYVDAFGPQMVEAWELALRIGSSVSLANTALAMATIVFSAQNFGAGNYHRMKQGLHVALRLSVLLVGGIGLLVSLSARSITIIATRDVTMISLVATIVLATMPFYVLCACADSFASIVRGAGEGFRPTLIILLGACALRVAWFALAIPTHHSIIAAFLAYPLTGSVALALMVPYYRHGNWLARSQRRARHLRTR